MQVAADPDQLWLLTLTPSHSSSVGSPFTVHFCAGFRSKGLQSSLEVASRETLKIPYGPP